MLGDRGVFEEQKNTITDQSGAVVGYLYYATNPIRFVITDLDFNTVVTVNSDFLTWVRKYTPHGELKDWGVGTQTPGYTLNIASGSHGVLSNAYVSAAILGHLKATTTMSTYMQELIGTAFTVTLVGAAVLGVITACVVRLVQQSRRVMPAAGTPSLNPA
jgi:hypothetical protein